MGADWPGRERELATEIQGAPAARRIDLLTQIAASTSPDGESVVVRALADPDPSVRLAAAQLAGRHRFRAARDALAAWLGDPQADVRAVASRALGALGDVRSLPALVRLLGDSEVRVRLAAVGAVAAIGGPEATVPLLNRLADAESTVRVLTARSLGDLGDPRAVLSLLGALQDGMPEVREATAGALGRLHDPRAVRGLLGLLRDTQLDVRVAATRALGTLGSPDAVLDLAPLALQTDRPGDPTRAALAHAAVDAIGLIGGATAREVLVRVFLQSEGAPDLARAAAESLRAMGPGARPAIPLLVARPVATSLLVPSARDAIGLVELLGDIGGDAAADALIALYDGPDGARLAEPILRSLGRTAAPAALRVLLRAIGAGTAPRESTVADRTDTARRGAVQGLSAFARARGGLEPEALDPLVAALQRPPRELSGDAARAFAADLARLIGETRNARATGVLAPLLSARQPDLRAAAARALATAGIAGAEAAAARALGDESSDVRMAIADALARFGERAALDAVLLRWNAGPPVDRVQAARALGRIGARTHDPRAARVLVDALARAAPELAAGILDALASLTQSGDTAALSALRAAADDEPRSVDALGALGNALDGASPSVRDAVRTVLVAHTTSERDPARIATAAWGLSRADVTVQPALLALVRSPSPAIAANAIGALARLWMSGVAPDPAARDVLCQHAVPRRHPAVRTNALIAVSRAGWSCGRADALRRMLTDGRADFARIAAVDALATALRAGGDEAAMIRTELAQCAAVDRSPSVAARCHDALDTNARASDSPATASGSPAPVEPDAEGVSALVERDDEEQLAVRAPVAIVFRDGVVRMAWTGPDGWVHDRPAPRGRYVVYDPEHFGLEP